MNARRAYCGLFDDFAARNKIGSAIDSVERLNEHLIHAVLVGDPLVINDGYVLMNPAIQEAIVKPEVSPFRALVKSRFITIVSRNGGDLAGLAMRMANDGITSAEDLLGQRRYREGIEPALKAWGDELHGLTWYRTWPARRTDVVYGRLSEIVLDKLVDQRSSDDEIRRFRDELGADSSSRTAWERTADRLYADGKLRDDNRSILMTGANEAYQYAWGCNLFDEDDPISVETRAGLFLGELDKPVGECASVPRSEVKVFVPDFDIARAGISRNWEILANASQQGGAPAAEKAVFRKELERYYTDPSVTEKEIDESAARYSRALAKIFTKNKKVKKVKFGSDIVFGVAAFGAPILFGPLGIAIGAFLVVAGATLPNTGPGRHLISRMGQTKPSKWVHKQTPTESSRSVSSFELDPLKIAQIVKDVPEFTPWGTS